uniref:Polyol transporter 5-like n=1 Tax=Rhizophora mucronata TaxID=61149 RepID=A0A2P2JH13_RHIMU
MGLVKTVFVLGATLFLDKFGRRPLLLSSYGGMIVSLLTLGFGLTMIDHCDHKLNWAVGLCISSVLVYVASFSIGAGPVAWVYTSEIFPLRLRAQGTSVGVATNRIASGVEAATFLSLYKAITIGGAFFLFAGIASVAWVFFYLCYPETRGKTLEDIEGLFGHFIKWISVLKEQNMKEENNETNCENNGQIQEPKTWASGVSKNG